MKLRPVEMTQQPQVSQIALMNQQAPDRYDSFDLRPLTPS